ncbi:MAG: transcriptional regulator GcvA [Maritimibacter sp.]|nr:transcriptional regulator GcvA [Maritimibacter sp.]
MTDRLPPLTALRAFDAAARHMSFQNAAAELNVTPAALSFQIKALEDHLGRKLFRRLNRAVALTEAGRALAPGAEEGFATLARAWSAARRAGESRTLTVTAGPSITARWLAPRIFDFASAHPDVDLRFTATFRLLDFETDEIDVAMRFTYDPDPALHAVDLGPEWFIPVMAPDLAARYPTAQSLTAAPLLSEDAVRFLRPRCDWPAWFRANGIDHDPSYVARFSQADHALDAAISGAGVLLVWRSVVARDLAEGRLVAPIPLAIESRAGIKLLCRKGAETRPQIAAFLGWVQRETAKTAAIAEGLTIVPAEDIPAR